jgi:hypothetical protein
LFPLQFPLQHSAAVVHAAPVLLQQLLLAPQVSPVQQSPAPAHGLPVAEHPHAPVPPLQMPVQQSAALLHACVLAMQPHLPVELQKGPGPQQSATLVQLAPVAAHPQVEVAELQTFVQH